MSSSASVDLMVDLVEIESFLANLNGDESTGALTITQIDADDVSITHVPLGEADALSRAAQLIAELTIDADTYINVNPVRTGLADYQRGTVEDIIGLNALFSDIDVGKPGCPTTTREAFSFVESLPLPPTFITATGGPEDDSSLHLWWLFKELLVFESAEERLEARFIAAGWQKAINAWAARYGWTFDAVGDITRAGRPPSTINHDAKGLYGSKRQVAWIRCDGPRYNPYEFEQYLPEDGYRPDDAPPAPEEGKRELDEQQLRDLQAALLPSWVDSKRHPMALYTSGWLANKGIAEQSAYELVKRCSEAAGDRKNAAKLKAVKCSYAKLRSGIRPTGYAGLKTIMTADNLAKADRVLAITWKTHDQSGNTAKEHKSNSAESAEDEIDRRPFPTDCLPDALRRLAEESEATLGQPSAFVAAAGLATIAAMAGSALQIQIKRGWAEQPIVWIAIIGDPGVAKSPAIDAATRPLGEIQRALRDQWLEEKEAWENLSREERGPAPKMRVVRATDSTIEGIASAMQRSRGVLSENDELTAWIAGHHRYRGKNASERGEHLKAWAGVSIVAVRATKEPIVIDRPHVALIGAIQPAKLISLAGEHPGEFANDGLLDRFFIAWPNAQPALWTDEEMPESTLNSWATLVKSLHAWNPSPDPFTHEQRKFATVRLNDCAKHLWQQWHDANVASITAANGLTRGWASKAPRHLLRLAVILHAGRYPQNPECGVDVDTLEAAIELVEWFREQHGLMLSALKIGTASAPAGLPGRILRIVHRHNDAGAWANRTAIRRGLGNTVKNDVLDTALEQLVAENAIVKRVISTGARPREEFLSTSSKYADMHFSHSEDDESPDDGANMHKDIFANSANRQNGHDGWMCDCGAINSLDVEFCPKCGANFEAEVTY